MPPMICYYYYVRVHTLISKLPSILDPVLPKSFFFKMKLYLSALVNGPLLRSLNRKKETKKKLWCRIESNVNATVYVSKELSVVLQIGLYIIICILYSISRSIMKNATMNQIDPWPATDRINSHRRLKFELYPRFRINIKRKNAFGATVSFFFFVLLNSITSN
jgi:hypothetical protein